MDDIGYLIGIISASCAPPVAHVPKECGTDELLINVLGGDRVDKTN